VNRAVLYGRLGRWLLHDLRNPAQALALLAELFSGDPGLARDPALTTALLEATTHLSRRLVVQDRLLRPQRPEATRGPVPIGPVLELVQALHEARHSAVDLRVEHDGDLPAVAGDDLWFEQALLNLVMNGYDAVGERADARIAIGVARQGDRVELTVEDNGPGISPELGNRAFEPFVTTAPQRAFAGLGLPVTRLLAERMGGSLARDPLDRGTRMRLTLRTWRAA
jgi:C4-dicarboxylate-specific signal transduction histidine kinase